MDTYSFWIGSNSSTSFQKISVINQCDQKMIACGRTFARLAKRAGNTCTERILLGIEKQWLSAATENGSQKQSPERKLLPRRKDLILDFIIQNFKTGKVTYGKKETPGLLWGCFCGGGGRCPPQEGEREFRRGGGDDNVLLSWQGSS